MSKSSETFCIIPWIHINTWPNGNVFQCCITDFRNNIGNLNENTLEEIWNNDAYKELRRQLMNNEKPVGCNKCYEQEGNNIRSFRLDANEKFAKHIEPSLENTTDDGQCDTMKLVYWDFRFSNLCNMKCRMCGGHLSSMWNKDEEAIYGRASEPKGVVNTSDNSIDDMYVILDEQISNVEEIYFAGGEPLIMDEHYYILEQLIKHGRTDVRLRYNTNLLKLSYKKWDVMELWSHFDNVQVIASIDAMGERGEYIRKGTVWDTIDKNIQIMIDSDILFGVSPTIQVMNALHITDFVQYLLDKGVTIDEIHLNNVLTNPQWYHVNSLLPELKEQVIQTLNDHVAQYEGRIGDKLNTMYNSIITYMDWETNEDVLKKFIEVTDKLDHYREETFVDTFPELKSHYDYAKGLTNE